MGPESEAGGMLEGVPVSWKSPKEHEEEGAPLNPTRYYRYCLARPTANTSPTTTFLGL